MVLRIGFFYLIAFQILFSSDRFPDLVELSKKVEKKDKVRTIEPIFSDLTLIELKNKLENFTSLKDEEKQRFLMLIEELQGKYDASYLRLKAIKNQRGELWYQMKDLYLTEKLGLEEEKAIIVKKLSERFLTMPLKVNKIVLCSHVKSFSQYTEIKKQQVKGGVPFIIYTEIDGVYQQLGKDKKIKSSIEAYYHILDDEDRLIYQHKKMPFSYTTHSAKRDYFVWFTHKTYLNSGRYTVKIYIKDLKNGLMTEEKHIFTVF